MFTETVKTAIVWLKHTGGCSFALKQIAWKVVSTAFQTCQDVKERAAFVSQWDLLKVTLDALESE